MPVAEDKILGFIPKFWRTKGSRVVKRSSLIGTSSWWSNFLAGFSTKSGANVNSSTAQSIPAYFRAVNLTSESIASLPWDVYEKRDGGVYIADNDPVQRLLKGRPSAYYDNFTFRDTLQRRLMAFGNAYCIIHKNGNGFPVDLEIWEGNNPDIYKHNEPGKRPELFYNFGDRKPLSQWDVIHLKAWSMDGLTGNNPLIIAREALGQAISQIEYGASFYGNGAHVSGSVETDKILTDPQRVALGNSIDGVSGTDNVGNILILDGGLKYKHIGVTPVDADLASGRRLSTEDIANITGVPVFLLNNLERATFSNIEHLARTFVQYTLGMHCNRWESEFSTKLFPQRFWGKKYIKFNLDGLLRGDTESRAKFYNSLFQVGAMSPNDIRRAEELNPYDGGDEYYVPLNMVEPDQQTEVDED